MKRTRKTQKNIPRVEKDNVKRPQPRTERAFLGWVIAFSTLSGVTRESILLFATEKRSKRQECGTRGDTSYTRRLSNVRPRLAEILPSATTIIREEWQISLCAERHIRHSISVSEVVRDI